MREALRASIRSGDEDTRAGIRQPRRAMVERIACGIALLFTRMRAR